MKMIPRQWKVKKVNGKLSFDKDKREVIVSFPFPRGRHNRSAKDIHIFQDKEKEFKAMAERAYSAMEYIGREFYTQGDHNIRVNRCEEGILTVKVLI